MSLMGFGGRVDLGVILEDSLVGDRQVIDGLCIIVVFCSRRRGGFHGRSGLRYNFDRFVTLESKRTSWRLDAAMRCSKVVSLAALWSTLPKPLGNSILAVI
jgi:hypothetical protein